MNTIHFSSLDLNLLRVFDTLIEERSVTRAGDRLGLSQSAISHALNRLRYVLNDELFVRVPDGMRPTPRAAEIAPRLREGLLQLQLALGPTEFDPARTERRFTVTCGEYIGTVVMPSFIARVRALAPNAELRIRPSNMGVGEPLLAGRVDLAIGSFRRVPDPFVCEPLFQESRVWVISADHPAARGELTLERLASLSHLIISAAGEDEHAVNGYVSDHGLERLVTRSEVGLLQGALAARGLRRMIGLTMPHFPAALAVVSRSDMAAPLPRRLAAAFAEQYRLRIFDPPYPSPPFDIAALWHRDHGKEPAIAWLRSVLREAAATM
ncbi:MAG: LysR family transcriptional regulator [Stellaceae bacterium]